MASTKPKLIFSATNFDETSLMRGPFQILKGFVEKGWQVEILTTADKRNSDMSLAWDKVPLVKVTGANKSIQFLKIAIRLFKRNKNELVMTWIWGLYNLALMLAKIWFKKPYVVQMDNYCHLGPLHSKDLLSRIMLGIEFGSVIRHSNMIFYETPNCYKYTKRYTKKAALHHVPNCLWQRDLKEIEAAWKEDGLDLKRAPIILFTGQIIPRKNLELLITAFSKIAKTFPEWKLEIRGPALDWPYLNSLKNLVAENDLSDRVDFEPALQGEDLYLRFRTTSVYCLPSQAEGMPSSIVEAMYFGGAIIAANVGAVGYQLDNGNCGLLHDPKDAHGLAMHLEHLLSFEKIRADLMQKAKNRVIKLFTWEQYFDAIEKRFRKLIQKKNSFEFDDHQEIRFSGTNSQKIAIVTHYTENLGKVAALTVPNHRQYAERHGYAYVVRKGRISKNRFKDPEAGDTARKGGFFWQKIVAIQELLSQKNHEWILWIDIDALFSNRYFKLENLIHEYGEDKHLIIAQDYSSKWMAINSGVLLLRNSQWSCQFIDKVASMYDEYKNAGTVEQEAVRDLIYSGRNGRKLSKNRKRFKARFIQDEVAVIPQRMMNSFVRDPKVFRDSKRSKWSQGDFIAHITGMSTVDKEQHLRKVLDLL